MIWLMEEESLKERLKFEMFDYNHPDSISHASWCYFINSVICRRVISYIPECFSSNQEFSCFLVDVSGFHKVDIILDFDR